MAEYGVDISVRVKRDQVDQLGRLLDQVEKQVGKLNRVKVSLDAGPANRALDALNNRLREAEQLANRFSGSNKIRAGIGAFSNSVGELSKELAAVRTSFDQAKTATDRQARALELLSGQFKKTRLEGQAFANASADFFDKGLGSLNQRLKEIEQLPRNLFSSGEAIRELTYLQSLAVQGTEEWLTVSKALGRQLAINANIRLGAQRAQGPMPQDPFGTRQLLLPAAGQSSGTFSIVERQAKIEGSLEQSVTRRAKAEARVAELKQLEIEQADRLNRSELSSIQNRTRAYQQDRKARAENLRNNVSSAVIGGAFPLLFGQGVGASFGGAVGGGIGARFGGQGGFAGSLVGTFAGQATIDFAINSVIQLGNALKKPTENIQELTKFLSIAGTEVNTTIDVLRGLGLESVAASVALEELEKRLGDQGFKDVKTISKDLQEFDNTLRDLRLAAALLGTKFKPLLDFITGIINAAAKAGLPRGGTLGTASNVAMSMGTGSNTRSTQNSGTQTTTADATVESVMARRVALAANEVSLERERLSLGRVALASRQGELQIQRLSVDLEEKKLNLLKEQDPAKRKLLGLEVQITEQQKRQAEAARQNAVIEAQRQLTRELNALEIQKIGIGSDINRLVIERVALQRGELAGIQASRDNLQTELNDRAYALKLQRDTALIGVNDLAVRTEINEVYKGQLQQLQIEINNRRASLNQQEAAYNLTQLQIKQQRELNNLQTKSQYAMQLRTLEAQRDPRFIGPFGGSRRTRELMTIEAQTNLFNMQSQLAALQSQAAAPGIKYEIKLQLEQQAQQLADQIALYERYQPAIIKATVAQERFNETLGFTRPVVDGVFEGMISLAESTKTTEQAFADFLRGISSLLFDVAKQMIAQYIALGIARKFAGLETPSYSSGSVASAAFGVSTGGFGKPSIADIPLGPFMNGTFGGARAAGGPVSAGRSYLVGERGPELFTPGRSGGISPTGSFGNVNVVVNVDATSGNVQGGGELGAAMGRVVTAAVQAELIKQKRAGGILS